MLTLTDKTFDKHREGDMPLFVMFFAEFAGPCAAAEGAFIEARNQRGNQIKFAKFDLDGNTVVPARYNVRQVPLFILFVGGEPRDPLAGAVPTEVLLEMLEDV